MAITLKDNIKKEIAETCSCEAWENGKPQNPGWRLVKFGKDCNWSITPEKWSVIEDNFGNIEINWTTKSTPIAPAIDMLSSVLKDINHLNDMIFIIKVADCTGKESEEVTILG